MPVYKKTSLGLNAKQLCEWFQSVRPDAKVTCRASSTRGGRYMGSSTLVSSNNSTSGYRVELGCDGDDFQMDTSNHYGSKLTDMLDWMLRYAN
jgi:hypothetical protein